MTLPRKPSLESRKNGESEKWESGLRLFGVALTRRPLARCMDEEDDGEAVFLWENGLFANEETSSPAPVPECKVASEKDMDVVFSFGAHRIFVPRSHADSAYISARIWRGSLLMASHLFSNPALLTNCTSLLELGCGRGLTGLLAKAVGGVDLACLLTDCDDRALQPLCSLANVAHFLWENDVPANRSVEVRHWSDAYRTPESAPRLGEDLQFDVLVASDCLYFACQEEPLAEVFLRRLDRVSVTAVALAVVQKRGSDGGFQLIRFRELLTEGGMSVEESEGPWPWPQLLQDHVRGWPGQEALDLAFTVHEVGDPVLLTVRWTRHG